MYWQKINLIYFSATGTTSKIMLAVAEGMGIDNKSFYRLSTDTLISSVEIPSDEISIFAFPVFAGRLPAFVPEVLKKFIGKSSPAILLCLYGNRSMDDALLELKNNVENNGFNAISAAAFIGQHSLFPEIAKGRPDASDMEIARNFGHKSMLILENLSSNQELFPSGKFPYRDIKKIPFQPHTTQSCNHCGLCAKTCPTRAINPNKLKEIDKNKCISCGRCISICPKKAKKIRGILYRCLSRKFEKNFSQRKEPLLIYCKNI